MVVDVVMLRWVGGFGGFGCWVLMWCYFLGIDVVVKFGDCWVGDSGWLH